ncbi:hypothetical protein JNN96_32665 [Mycobacterium sp. DSM 3803]|nr:hypothetical protein [Mycobacterium sp. DSM 3803]
MRTAVPQQAAATAAQLDHIADKLNQISAELAAVLKHGGIPTTAAAVFPLAWARGNLGQTVNMIAGVADQLDPEMTRFDDNQDQAAVDAADAEWAAPRWQVDSTTRTCCGGIGNHTRECAAVN